MIWLLLHRPLTRYAKLRVAHAPGMLGTFSPPPQVSDPDIHHGTCVTHVPWCMQGSLTSGFLWSRRRGKHYRRMHNPQFCVSVKRPMPHVPPFGTQTDLIWYMTLYLRQRKPNIRTSSSSMALMMITRMRISCWVKWQKCFPVDIIISRYICTLERVICWSRHTSPFVMNHGIGCWVGDSNLCSL